VCIDITEEKPLKLQGLRTYRSQADAQALAVIFESDQFSQEWFYQAYPEVSPTAPSASGFWDEALPSR
jgi:hypothetical protein